ncbi:phage head-tail connector protein [Sporanaerobacter acetigenes]|uniref:Phage gp6-like head-tail connector protein n=1 Tax=Sporanaerobacter acetigenes DSM 13106 TaxID=1123281 RepID=A0A1M5TZX8_9FIRM|nr:phage head-tail connector protein [Sporanaerobacter acetigenes]SHH56181.1 Phage gp6-like head-tail connector protein [Sporanaerobacter acetigenes DSM 13106]
MEQLDRLKIKLGVSLGDTDEDNLLNLYLEDAENEILELTHLDKIPSNLLSTQIDLAIIMYNKQGIEGQTSHSEGGISRSFEEGIPESIMKKIRSARRLPR